MKRYNSFISVSVMLACREEARNDAGFVPPNTVSGGEEDR